MPRDEADKAFKWEELSLPDRLRYLAAAEGDGDPIPTTVGGEGNNFSYFDGIPLPAAPEPKKTSQTQPEQPIISSDTQSSV